MSHKSIKYKSTCGFFNFNCLEQQLHVIKSYLKLKFLWQVLEIEEKANLKKTFILFCYLSRLGIVACYPLLFQCSKQPILIRVK